MKKASLLAIILTIALISNLVGMAFIMATAGGEVDAEALSVSYDFSNGNPDGPLAVNNLTHTNNGSNNLFIGGQSGYNNIGNTANTAGSLVFKTTNLSDFAVTINDSNSPENNAIISVKAYISSESSIGYSEISLKKELNTTQPSGWKSYIYSVNTIADIIDSSSYVKIEVYGINGQVQIMGFKYFYAPKADINEGYQFISYDYSKGLAGSPAAVDKLIFSSNAPNQQWLGGDTGYNNQVNLTGSLTFKTDDIYNFAAIVNAANIADLQVKAYVSESIDTGFTEIAVKGDLNPIQPTGWRSQIFSAKNVTDIPEGTQYVKIEVTGAVYGVEIMGFTYYYGNKGDEPNYEPNAINGGFLNTVYNFANGFQTGPVSTGKFTFASNGSNDQYIGSTTGYVYTEAGTGTMIFETDSLFNFDVTINIGDQTDLSVKAFVSAQKDSGYMPIELERGMNTTQPTGWRSFIYSPKTPENIPAGMKYVKLEISGVLYEIQVLGFRYFYNDTIITSDLDISSKLIDFSAGTVTGVIAKSNFDITMNSEDNAPFLGGQYGYVFLAQKTGEIKFFTGNVRDFVTTINMPDIKAVDVKAYISASKDKDYTEIQLVKQLNTIQPTGWQSYMFRPKNRDLIPEGTMYVKLIVTGPSYMLQMMGFKYFFEGDEIAPPAPDNPLGDGSVISDIVKTDNIKSYNFIKNNMNYTRIDNMFITSNSQGNIDYIGTAYGMFMTGESTGFVVFRTMGIKDFWVRINFFDSSKDLVNVKIYVAPTDDDSLYQEIDTSRSLSLKQPTGMKSYIYTSTGDVVFPDGVNYIKIAIDPIGAGNATFQLVGLDYQFETPIAESLPDFATPTGGELEMLDDLTSVGLTSENNGKMFELLQMEWKIIGLGTNNGSDKAIIKEDYIADGYLIYNLNGMKSFDVRGYKHPECQQNMEFYISSDNVEWTKVDDVDFYQTALMDGPLNVSYQKKSLPRGSNYLKILIPELEGAVSDLSISDVQVIYTDVYYNPNTSDMGFPIIYMIFMMSAAGIFLTILKGKKNNDKIKNN